MVMVSGKAKMTAPAAARAKPLAYAALALLIGQTIG
jgi:hypothetical protein